MAVSNGFAEVQQHKVTMSFVKVFHNCFLGKKPGFLQNYVVPKIYSAADLLVLPSKFDTFSCVTLESFSCGLPVIAYRTKGPKDIIEHNVNGFLARTKSDIVRYATNYLQSASSHQLFRIAAMKRAASYKSVDIMDELLRNTGVII